MNHAEKDTSSIFEELSVPAPNDVAVEPLSKGVEVLGGMPVHNRAYYSNKTRTRIPYLRIADLQKEGIRAKGIKHLETRNLPKIQKYLVQENDILLSIAGTIGKLTIVPHEFSESIASKQLAILRPKKGQTNPQFILYMLSSKHIQHKLQQLAKGAYIRHLSFQDLRHLHIPLPSKASQDNIVRSIQERIIRKKMSELFAVSDGIALEELISHGESDKYEFKPSLFVKYKNNQPKNDGFEVMKGIAAFMNSEGGTLLIGVADNGSIMGIENDFESLGNRKNWDGWLQQISNLMKQNIGVNHIKRIHIDRIMHKRKIVAKINVDKSSEPVYLVHNVDGKKSKAFYVRTMNASHPLDIEESHHYIMDHWG